MLFLSGIMGIVITLSVLMVCTTSSPVSVNITGTIKDVLLTYAGFVFFQNVHISPSVIMGLAFSFLGASYYGYNSYSAMKQSAKLKLRLRARLNGFPLTSMTNNKRRKNGTSSVLLARCLISSTKV